MSKAVGLTRIIVAQLGARMHYAVPRMLHSAGMLDHFYTDICAVKGWPRFIRYIPESLQSRGLKRLIGRQPIGIPPEKITAFNSLGLTYAISRLKKNTSNDLIQMYILVGKRFCREIIAKGLPRQGATYTFNSAGLELMEAAKRQGLCTIMEQTIAPQKIEQALLEAAYRKYPEWEKPEINSLYLNEFVERETVEWQLADLILCGSEFVKEGIARCGGPVDRCRVVPYGVDERFSQVSFSRKLNSCPLRVLTVGEMGIRKGVPDVIKAARIIGKSCLFRLVGNVSMPDEIRNSLPANVEVVGPVPRNEIIPHYKWADVFLLPSICEGSATVTYEALSAGLPVICTPNTGSIVEDGIDGFIVPIFQPEYIVQCLMKFVDDPDVWKKCSESARKKIDIGSLEAYQERFLRTVKEATYIHQYSN
jgi:glycosyltransferase involved in cell wall biosynthesis